jgi:hypothetical protein
MVEMEAMEVEVEMAVSAVPVMMQIREAGYLVPDGHMAATEAMEVMEAMEETVALEEIPA